MDRVKGSLRERRWLLPGIPGGAAASHRGRRPGQSVPRLQAGQGRAKVRGPGHPCTRRRVRPGEPGSGPERCWEGPRCPDECLRRPEPPHSAAGRPAGPPTWGSPASRRHRAGHRPGPRSPGSERAPAQKLHTRIGVGGRVGGPSRGSGLRWTRKTRGACAPRQDGLRAAPLPRRRHAPTRPSAGLHRAAPHPPTTGPGAPPPSSFCPHPCHSRRVIKAFRVAEVTSRELLGTRRTARYLTIFFSSTGYAHYFIIKKKSESLGAYHICT
uniref:Uncharacterized protein n=1 Tax=Mus musculus TaxID=10090 RepID=Q8CDX3_MOUSE|nr:unnamed protein product [Mus musculus]